MNCHHTKQEGVFFGAIFFKPPTDKRPNIRVNGLNHHLRWGELKIDLGNTKEEAEQTLTKLAAVIHDHIRNKPGTTPDADGYWDIGGEA